MIAQTQPSADRLATPAPPEVPAEVPAALAVPRPRATSPVSPVAAVSPVAPAAPALTAPGAPVDHVELIAAELLSTAAVLTWVGRLVLLVALGLTAWLVLMP